MAHTDRSVDTLISISGTMASIGLALVGILAAKASIDHTQTLADDLFLFSSLGFLLVLALGYLVQKRPASAKAEAMVTGAEWIFSASLLVTVLGTIVLVYTEI